MNKFEDASNFHGAARYAIDDDLSTMVHNDMNDNDPVWIGELQSSVPISKIEIFNRKWGWKAQMSNYLVSVLNDKKETIWENKYLDATSLNGLEAKDILVVDVPENIAGKYVRIKCYRENPIQSRKTLSFAEVKVYGKGGSL